MRLFRDSPAEVYWRPIERSPLRCPARDCPGAPPKVISGRVYLSILLEYRRTFLWRGGGGYYYYLPSEYTSLRVWCEYDFLLGSPIFDLRGRTIYTPWRWLVMKFLSDPCPSFPHVDSVNNPPPDKVLGLLRVPAGESFQEISLEILVRKESKVCM